MSNKLMIAAAGAGKTTYIINEAVKLENKKILITTFTEANEQEIKNKIIKIKGYIPSNITIQSWFSFLIKHGIKPYQSVMFECKINGVCMVNRKSGFKYNTKGKSIYYSDNEIDNFFNGNFRIYSDKISKLAYLVNKKSNGAIVNRLTKIFDNIYIDEIQDMAGYDLEFIKLILQSNINVCMVGDIRQTVYSTHWESKNKQYKYSKLLNYFKKECENIVLEIDDSTLKWSYRNCKEICYFSNKLYKEYSEVISLNYDKVEHKGLFYIKEEDIERYLSKYKPVQLIHDSKTKVNKNYLTYNFGGSKGLTFDRVLIHPTKDMLKWFKTYDDQLSDPTKAKLYVALTRAKYSVAIVDKYNIKAAHNDIPYYK